MAKNTELYLEWNNDNYGSRQWAQGYRITRCIKGLSEDVRKDLVNWQRTLNNVQKGIKFSEDPLWKKCIDKVKQFSNEQNTIKKKMSKFYCYISPEEHAFLYFSPGEVKKTEHRLGTWVDIDALSISLRCDLRLVKNENEYFVNVDKPTWKLEERKIFLGLIVNANIDTLEMAAALAGVYMGNYIELESDCLEYTKTVVKLLGEGLGGKLNKEALQTLTVEDPTFEALSRNYAASRILGHSHLASKNPHTFPFHVLLLIVAVVVGAILFDRYILQYYI